MKILYISHRIPFPPDKGEKIRTFHQIQELAKRHSIYLCSFVDEQHELSYVPALLKYCASVDVVRRSNRIASVSSVIALLQGHSLSVKLFYREALDALIRRKLAAEAFDCVMVSCASMAQYVSARSDIPKIIDLIDVDSEKWRSYARCHPFPLSFIYRLEADRLARYEENTAHAFDHTLLSSAEEARLFGNRVLGVPVSVISNGVDLEFYSLSAAVGEPRREPVIVFTGVMDYFPNVDAVEYFCREIFPDVRATVPTAQFYIVGRNPTRHVKELGKQTNVTVTGTVPDVRPYLAQARVAIAPFRLARGVQNKVLEAMAMGVPVVGTNETFKGIGATEADGIRVADDPAAFARHVLAFLQTDPESLSRFGAQTRSYVERHHRWEDQGEKLERILMDVVKRNSGSIDLEVKRAAVA